MYMYLQRLEAWEAKQQQQQKEKVETQSLGPRVYPVKRPPHLKSKVSGVQKLQYYMESVDYTGWLFKCNTKEMYVFKSNEYDNCNT